MRAILAVGLEPALGFYHTPRSAAHPLVLDLMELFRVPLWDMVVIGSFEPRAVGPGRRLRRHAGEGLAQRRAGGRRRSACSRSGSGRTWKHPVVNYSLSYARTIELEARLLEKEWSGEPGLFARLRLR